MRWRRNIAFAFCATGLGACAALGGKTDVDELSGANITVVSYEAESRGAYFAHPGHAANYCAEPPPDVALDRALKTAAKAKSQNIEGELNAELSSKAIQLAGRSQIVLLARELLYRTCEMSLNGKLTDGQINDNYNKVINLISQLGAAEMDDSSAELERQKIRRLQELKSTGVDLGDH